VIEQEAEANFKLQQEEYKKKLKVREKGMIVAVAHSKSHHLNGISKGNIILPIPIRG
jgi:hypothetical protein